MLLRRPKLSTTKGGSLPEEEEEEINNNKEQTNKQTKTHISNRDLHSNVTLCSTDW